MTPTQIFLVYEDSGEQAAKSQPTKGKLIMMMTRWLPWVKESEEGRGSKRQGGRGEGGGGEREERREAELEECGFALERSRLRTSSRPKGANKKDANKKKCVNKIKILPFNEEPVNGSYGVWETASRDFLVTQKMHKSMCPFWRSDVPRCLF